MATPSVSAVLSTPEIAAAIDACTELWPGVSTSKENIAPLWAHMCQKAAWGKDGVFANHVNAFAAGVQAKNNLERAKTQGQVATVREQISDRTYSNNPDFISPYS